MDVQDFHFCCFSKQLLYSHFHFHGYMSQHRFVSHLFGLCHYTLHEFVPFRTINTSQKFLCLQMPGKAKTKRSTRRGPANATATHDPAPGVQTRSRGSHAAAPASTFPPPPTLPTTDFTPDTNDIADVIFHRVMARLAASGDSTARAVSPQVNHPVQPPAVASTSSQPPAVQAASCSSALQINHPPVPALSSLPHSSATSSIAPPSSLATSSIAHPSSLATSVAGPATSVAPTHTPSATANAALQALLGESNSPSAPMRISTPLGAHVPVHRRERIWKGQFVELALLLPAYASFEEEEGDEKDKKRARKLPPLTIDDYSSAFHNFMSIRIMQHPQDACGMLKHLETVRKMNESFGHEAWTYYNRNFRLGQHHNPSIQWGSIDMELYLQASALGLRNVHPHRNPGPSPRSNPQSELRPNTCWAFQRRGENKPQNNCTL